VDLSFFNEARRYLEIRRGELLGDAQHGGDRTSDQVAPGPLEIEKTLAHPLRQLAEAKAQALMRCGGPPTPRT
jgi:hypothetical protein